MCNDKMKQNNTTPQCRENPVIFLIQPVIQNLTCIQPMQISASKPRPILPKASPPVLLTLPVPVNFVFNQPQSSMGNIEQSNQTDSISDHCDDQSTQNHQFQSQKTIATQTACELEYPLKLRESKASQCNRRVPKSVEVGTESIHTQTAESAVVKIKKRRSRRKSVAITTEASVVTDQNVDLNQSLWPGFHDFIFQHADNIGLQSLKNSAATQTNSNKVLCDSQTITDEELFKFTWDDVAKEKETNETCSSPFEILSDIAAVDSLTTLQGDINHNTLSELNIFANNAVADNVFDANIKTYGTENSSFQNPPLEKDITSETCSLFSVFGNCSKPELQNKVSQPTLSDIHTQTMASTILDDNLLANMETQTTDDFIFSDLEFSDTETQTPWEDFPNIDDSPMQADQLSIEIQTDFSSFNPGLNQDPYKFINSMDVQSMIGGCSNKETLGVNIETQTLDKLTFPQFTNSESQTLDMSDFIFTS
ncbi:hypothetical protein X975_22768, partial [Stegodyphus mimosarum]